MARFHFRLQSILNLKVRLEEQARLDFAEARRRLDEEEERLEHLHLRKLGYEDEARQKRNEVLNVQDILETEVAIVRIGEYIEEQKAQVRLYEQRLEEARGELVNAIRERKTYERLREKAFEEYIAEENHAEGVENDEHNSFVYGRKQLS